MDTLGMGRYFCWGGKSGKMILSLLIVLLSLVLLIIRPSLDRILCAGAMIFSSAGDFMLIDELEERRSRLGIKNCFVKGGIFFMLAHVLYILTFWTLLKQDGYHLSEFNLGSRCGVALFLLLVILFAVICAKKKDFSKYPLFLAYVLLLTADCFMAFTYSAAALAFRPISILAALGAFSFMISDLILGLGVIGGIQKFAPYLWWFYPIGQILMILAG